MSKLMQKPKFRSYRKDDRGNVAMISGLTIIPIIALAGFAIDFQATTTQKNLVQAAVDSAVIAGSRSMQNGASEEEVSAEVNRYVQALTADAAGGLQCGLTVVTFAENSEDISASINCSQKTTLTQLIGKQKMDFHVSSGSTYGVGKVDVSFVFDVSGSMDSDGRMDALKEAAEDAVETLLAASSGETGDVRIAMVPYATGVNAGQYYEAVTADPAPQSTWTIIQEIDCAARADDGYCAAWYDVGSEETMTSQRRDTCTFDRTGSAAFTNTVASEDDPLAVSPYFELDLDQDRNFLDNGGVNTDRFRRSDYRIESSAGDWESTLNNFKFWRNGAGSWRNRVYSKEGRHMLEINTTSGIISQEVDVEVGEYYNVVFSMRRRPGQGASTSRVRAHWTEASVPLVVSSLEGSGQHVEITPGSSWETYHYVVLATDEKMRVSFEGIDGDDVGGLLDYVWVSGRSDHCPVQEPLPLTADQDDLEDFIDAMVPRGGTSGHHGIAWGWYAISNEWASIWPENSAPHGDNEANVTKAMIVMTDGEFNHTRHEAQGTSAEQAEIYCDNAKADGVVIFTIAFSAPEEGEEILEYCASGESRAFQANNKEELKEAYQQIATSIADLRISF